MSMSVPGNSCCTSFPSSSTNSGGCPILLPGTCVYYSGTSLPGPGINTGDKLNVVITKLTNYTLNSQFVVDANSGVFLDDVTKTIKLGINTNDSTYTEGSIEVGRLCYISQGEDLINGKAVTIAFQGTGRKLDIIGTRGFGLPSAAFVIEVEDSGSLLAIGANSVNTGDPLSGGLQLSFRTQSPNQEIKLIDDINHRGIEYSGDYEPNFLPRTLVTKQYVDDLIASPPEEIDVFLIGGQSNARGVGNATQSPNPAPNTVYEYDLGAFTMVTNEVGHLPSNRGSMWPSFGIRYNHLTSRKVCFIPVAADGTGQTVASDYLFYGNWSPVGTLYPNSITQKNAAISAISAAGYIPVFKGVLWCQGENDAYAINNALQTKADYKAAFLAMIANYRTDFSDSTLPFYIYQTGGEVVQPALGYLQVREAQQEVADADTLRNIMVSTNAFDFIARGLMADNVHWNQTALNEQGNIGAEKVVNGTELLWQRSGSYLSYLRGNVGIGIKLPANPLQVISNGVIPTLQITNSNSAAIAAQITSTSGIAAQFTTTNNGADTIFVENTSAGTGAGATIRFKNNLGLNAQMFLSSSTHGSGANRLFIHSFLGDMMIGSNNAGFRIFTGASGPTNPNTKFNLIASGQIGVGLNVTPHASALIDMVAGDRGFRVPVMTTLQQNAIVSPATGLLIYNNTILDLMQYNGTAWVRAGSSGTISNTAVLDFPSTNAQISSDLTIALTGAVVGDSVLLGVPNGSVSPNTCYTSWVSATNVVTVRFNNYSSASVDPASGTFKVTIIK